MSNKPDLAKIGGQLNSLLGTIKKRAVKGATGGISAGTSVRSTIGYWRWSAGSEDPPGSAELVDDDAEETIRLTIQEEPDNAHKEEDILPPAAIDDADSMESGSTYDADSSESSGESTPNQPGSPLQLRGPVPQRPDSPPKISGSVHSLTDGVRRRLSSTEVDIPHERASSKIDTITEWQAGWNVTNAIQGMFIVSFPYTVHQGGYWSLMAMVVVAYICCYTGKILVACLYEEQKDGRILRVRSSYGDIAERVFGKRFGRPIINVAQVIELLMTCILYVLLCGDLLKGSFNKDTIPLSAWITISIIPLLPCAFIKTMRRVSWLSLWCSVAHMLINIIIIIYCLTLVKQWKPKSVTINPSIGTVPIAMGIIVFSYTSQIFLPTLEGRMVKRDKFHCMLHWTHIAAAIFKALFAYIGYVTWGEETQEVITNNLPMALRVIVNIILVLKALLSYPLPYFAAAEIIESVFFQDQSKTLFTSCYKEDLSIKWWGILLRLLLVLLTMIMAIFIPHFAILMGLIGSFTGTMLSFVWPCIFHLYLRRDRIKWYQKGFDVLIILLGICCGALGIYSSSRALVRAFQAEIPDAGVVFTRFSEKAVNETMKSKLLG